MKTFALAAPRRRRLRWAGLVLPALLVALPPWPVRAADAPERADALIVPAVANNLLAKFLPQPIQIAAGVSGGAAGDAAVAPPFTAWLIEARYCGGADGGRGRILGVVRSSRRIGSTVLLDGRGDCQATLEKLAKRSVFADAADTALVEFITAFAPWQVRLSIGSFVTSPAGGAALGAAMTRAPAAAPVLSINTGGQTLSLPDLPPQTFDVAVRFQKGSGGGAIALTLTPPSAGAGGDSAIEPAEPLTLPEGAEAVMRISDGLGNRLLAQATQDGPLVVPIDRQAIELRSLRLTSHDDRATMRASATPRGIGESVGLSIDAAGGDLKLVEVRAQPELEDCAGLSMISGLGCRARNTARSAAANTLAAELTGRTRGQTVRSLAAIPVASLAVGAHRLRIRVTPTRLRSTPAGLTATGTIDVATDAD